MTTQPNWKMLGIEKEAIEMISEFETTDLTKLIDSSYFECPYITNRKPESDYCNIEVTGCQDDSWWYAKLIGFEFFCRIEYRTYTYGKYISAFKGIRLMGKKEIIFRDFDPKDVMIK